MIRCTSDPAARTAATPDEAFLAWVWQARAFREGWLSLADGSALRVVFPGRRWGGPGPDFRGAVLERPDATLERGDVEVHGRAADWGAHRHGHDPEYARVVLHVVWRASAPPARRPDGAAIPTLALADQIGAPLAALQARYRAAAGAAPSGPACVRDAEQAAALLDAAGMQRFLARSAALEGDLTCLPVAQVAYRELLVAMGYSANKEPCRRLAEALPYDELVGALLARPAARRADAAQALLLGRAGLLPEQEQPVPGGLLQEWAALDRGHPTLPRQAWRVRACRPDNTPARRLAGLALWLAGRVGADWPGDLALRVRQAAAEASPRSLADLFRVRATDDFWPFHFDFGRPATHPRPWLIGGGRAMEVVVSVLLPLLHALGEAGGDETLSAAALRCYRRFPATPGNRVTRAMLEQVAGGMARGLPLSACRQQGLLHLYREWCAERWCARCPAGVNAGGRD
jgi:hypothetical protein